MTLTIELPKLIADYVTTWDSETLRNIAVEAVVRRIQDDAMKEIFDANGESLGFYGPVLEEIPMDDETIAALKEARDDRDAGRHYSTEEMVASSNAALEAWRVQRGKA